MANLVHRATSDKLSGPDWAMNMELCNLINNDPGLAKHSIKAIKKRMANKNPKIQVLTLMVLETMVKNCGDAIHHQVATRDILNDMVKIVKKNKDSQVREKILLLLDSWQEGFGGPNGRYPQYFIAYNELWRSGIIFPGRTDTANTNLTPPQIHPIAPNYNSSQHTPINTTPGADASRSSELPVLSLADIQNARSGMEVLAEMLNAIDPKNRQALRDEVIVELVEQCRTAEKRVMQLVNSTVNEELLQQGLALNDDLKKVLVKLDTIESGVHPSQEPATAPPLLIDNMAQDDSDNVLSQLTHRSMKTSSTSVSQLGLPTSHQWLNKASFGSPSAPTMDLLSGDMFQGKFNSPQVVSSSVQKSLDSVSLFSYEGEINAPSNLEFQTGQGVSPPVIYNLHQETDVIYKQQNGGLQNQFGSLSGQTNKGSYQTVNPSGSTSGNEQTTANPGSSALSSQQSALIYGGCPPSGSSLSAQQGTMMYGTNKIFPQPSGSFPSQQETMHFGAEQSYPYGTPQSSNVSQPNIPSVKELSNMSSQLSSFQGYIFPLQLQQPHMPSQSQQEQSPSPGSYAYNQGMVDSKPISHSLPPAPWSTENATNSLNLDFNGNSFVLPQDQQQLQFQYAGISGQMQSLSLQSHNGFYPAPQLTAYTQEADDYTMFRTQGIPKKEVKNDVLFKDLVDLSKGKKQG